jgi:hypothetical protein
MTDPAHVKAEVKWADRRAVAGALRVALVLWPDDRYVLILPILADAEPSDCCWQR